MYWFNADGQYVRLVVNYLAPYVQTNALLPTLREGQNAHIINLSSAVQAPVSLSALQSQEKLNTNAAYPQSKLGLTMWIFDLDLVLFYKNAGVTGKYFDNDKGDPKGSFANAHVDAYDAQTIAELLPVTKAVVA